MCCRKKQRGSVRKKAPRDGLEKPGWMHNEDTDRGCWDSLQPTSSVEMVHDSAEWAYV